MAIGNPVSTTSSSVASKTSSVIATAGQTLFTVPAGYVTNHISVFRNGIRLVDGRDYEARNGATVTLLAAATVGDVIEFHVFDTFSVADAVTNQGGTIFGDLTVEGSIGNITGVAATFTGAVSVGGVLTYEDVTNIDSVGIITARSDLSIADKIIHTGDTNTAIRFPAADTITAETGGSERLRIDSNGNMGLGTNSPSNILHISSADPRLRITDTSGTTSNVQADILFQAGLGGSAVAQIGYTANDDIFRIKTTGAKPVVIGTADAERLRIDSSGRMGLGTNSPTDHGGYGGTLEISGSPGGALYLKSGSDVGQLGMNSSGLQLRTRTAKDILFTTNNTERMRIDSFGRLGFGASNNSSYDSNAQNVLIASDSHTGITIRSGGSSHFAMIHFADGTTGAAQQRAGRILYQHDGNNMTFHTDNTERLRIDGSGRMGLGTNSPAEKLHVNATGTTAGDGAIVARFYDAAQSKGLFLGYDSNEVGGTIYGANLLTFQTYNGSSWGERMRIDGSGRLLLGTTTTPPIPNGQKIYVAGTGSIDSGIQCARFHPSYGGYAINIGRSRGSTIGTFTSVSNNDDLGSINWHGADGTDMSSMAASINAEVDGTPGSNDMPGRLVFSTTADSASSPTERMRIDSSGKLTIGATSFISGLNSYAQVMASGTQGGLVINSTDTSASSYSRLFFTPNGHITGNEGLIRYNNNDYHMAVYTQGAERLRIDSSGRVMIGTTTEGYSDADDLTVASSGNAGITIRSGTTNAGAIYFSDGTSGNAEYRGYIEYSQNSEFLRFGTAAAEKMRIDSAGRLMLGRTSATHRLSLVGTANDRSAELQLTASNVASGYFGPNADGLNIGTDTAGIVFKTGVTGGGSVGATGTERMRIDSSGRMGLGTNNPQAPFVISNSGAQGIEAGYSSGTSTNFIQAYNRSSSAFIQLDVIGNPLVFKTGTGAAERMRLSSAGSLTVSTYSSLGGNGSAQNLGIHQVTGGKTTMSSSNSWKKLFGSGHTFVGTVKLYVTSGDTLSGGGVAKEYRVLVAYGSAQVTEVGTYSYGTTAGNLSGIQLRYNNSGYQIQARVTWSSGSTPVVNWSAEGLASSSWDL